MADYNPDTDPRSSNSLIHGYLQSKGLPLTSENVRRALEANAQNPGMIRNDASKLYNGLPATEAEDQAAMAAAAANRAPASAARPGASNPSMNDGQNMNPNTSASPNSGGGGGGSGGSNTGGGGGGLDFSSMPWLESILTGGAVGAGYGASRLFGNRSPGTAATPNAPGVPAVNLAPPAETGGMRPTQGPVDRITLPENEYSRVVPQLNGTSNRLTSPEMPLLGDEPHFVMTARGPQPALGGSAPQQAIGAPAPQLEAPRLQITGPGPQADVRPQAVPEQPIALPGSRVQPITQAPVGQPVQLSAPQMPQPGTAPPTTNTPMVTNAPTAESPTAAAINKAIAGDAPAPRARAPRARAPRVRVPG